MLFCLRQNFLWKYLCLMFCLCMKKNCNFLHFSVLCFISVLCICFSFLNWVASISSIQATGVQFSTSCSSRLPFGVVFEKFDNLSSVFWCFYDIESTVYYSFPRYWNLTKCIPLHMIPSTPCYLRLKRSFLTQEFLKNSSLCCRSDVYDFSRLIYPCPM